jgi:MFS superfamily sulfate permease-like transporter
VVVVVVVVDAFVVGVVVVVVDAFVVGVTDVAFLARVVHDMSERDSDSISRTDEKTITKRFLSFIIPPF